MKLRNFFISSICLLFLSAFIAPKANAQHTVLFETFGEVIDDCDLGTTFYSDMGTVLSDKSSKIIHLDYHVVNFNDPFCAFNQPPKDAVGTRLFPGNGNVFYGAVDRTHLPAESDQNNPSWAPDMENEIDVQHNISPIATMQLTGATLDKSLSARQVFNATVAVTATSDISDSLIIRYAIVQDKVTMPSKGGICPGTKTLWDDIVRFITNGDSVVFVPGTPAGTVKNVTYHLVDLTNGGNPNVKVSNMRFIAFLETSGGGEFHIINAADLKDDLDTLKSPPASLAIVDSSMDGRTFSPGDNASIAYNSTFLPSGVKAYYSLDNGATWVYITDATSSPINWTVPDSLTTQGKIQLVSKDDASLTSTEKGTFVIKISPTLGILHPVNTTDTVKADSAYTIQWSEQLVNSVTLEYAIDAQFSQYQLIAHGVTGTSYNWKAPDTNIFAKLRITDDNADDHVVAISNAPFLIRKFFGGPDAVSPTTPMTGLTITSIAPNPANNGDALVIRYSGLSSGAISLDILDLLGRTVTSRTLIGSNSGEADIPTQNLSAGSYIVRMNDGTNTVTKRVEIVR